MPDKYQQIRDFHEIELAKLHTKIDDDYKQKIRNLYISVFVSGAVLIFLMFVT